MSLRERDEQRDYRPMRPGRHLPYRSYRKSKKDDRLFERRKEMSITKNMKRRMLMVMALAMTIALLASGTARADTLPMQTTLTSQASADSVEVGEPVTFHITQTNYEPYPLTPVMTGIRFDAFSPPFELVSASSSQGECTFLNGGGVGPRGEVACELGTLPPGASANIDIVVIPEEPGTLTTMTDAALGVIGRAPGQINPITHTHVTVEESG
jgi:hypothetical protein